MSGNTERQSLKIFIWKVRDDEDGCQCQIIAVGCSASEAEQQALKTIDSEVRCGWCIEPHVFFDVAGRDIDDINTWKNHVKTTAPLIFEVEKGAVILN